MTDTYRAFFNAASRNEPYVMPIYGNRPGDNAARQKKLAETLPEKPGIIIGAEFRHGDKVPCRRGDIIAGVCGADQTAKDAEEIRQAGIAITARMLKIMASPAENMTRKMDEVIATELKKQMFENYQRALTEAATNPVSSKEMARQMQETAAALAAQSSQIDIERGRQAAEELMNRVRLGIPSLAPAPQ